MALITDAGSSSKYIERLSGSGGLYILKQSHLLFDIVSSEQMHSEKLKSKSLILSQIIPLLRNTIRQSPFFIQLDYFSILS